MFCFHFLKAKKIYFYIHSFPNVIYCTEIQNPLYCHILTALTRYFSVHDRIDFHDLTALYIIIVVVTVDLGALGVLYSSLCINSFSS